MIEHLKFNRNELNDLLKAWVVLSLAFAILLSDGPKFNFLFVKNLLVAAFTVGIGFLFHELAHKYLAQKYGCRAEFKAYPLMLAITLLGSLFGFIFAAPGAVFISGRIISTKRNGKISLAGPMMNIFLAIAFYSLVVFATSDLMQLVGSLGSRINAWLALFNLIPFGPLDGRKVWAWNKVMWVTFTLMALLLVLVF